MPKRTTAPGHTAIEKAVRGATAMDFAWVELRDAEISGHEVNERIDAVPGPVRPTSPCRAHDIVARAPGTRPGTAP
jgi:hypothetical protein